MKKLINRAEHVVEEMVDGLVAVFPGLVRLPGQTVLVRADLAEFREHRVALISGGGSGHEPAHAGYVGRGMLSAAVAGDVFTSPSPDAVLAALRAVTGPPGAVLIVKNYTGDRLNFGLAAELARAEGMAVEVVVVADDVALAATADQHAGRRGLAGTIFVHKVAGAAAESGASLAQVVAEARAAADAVATMGVALTPCTVPAAGAPGFTLDATEIELGLGIHGEPGVRRGPLEPADALVDHLLDAITTDTRLARGDRVALMINNLGGTPTMELLIVARRAIATLEGQGVAVERVLVGTFLSALEMAGVSLSVLRVDDTRLARLDAPTSAPAWQVNTPRSRTASFVTPNSVERAIDPPSTGPPQTSPGRALEAAIRAASEALIAASAYLTALDQAVGDGDLGISLSRGAGAVLESLPATRLDDPAATLHALGLTLQRTLGGTSGPLYGVFFVRGAALLRLKPVSDPRAWADAFHAGCSAIAELGGAGLGDRTMLDALFPAADAFRVALDAGQPIASALSAASAAATAAAAATSSLPPRRGRSSYLGDRALGHRDPGAEAAAIWLRAIAGLESEDSPQRHKGTKEERKNI